MPEDIAIDYVAHQHILHVPVLTLTLTTLNVHLFNCIWGRSILASQFVSVVSLNLFSSVTYCHMLDYDYTHQKRIYHSFSQSVQLGATCLFTVMVKISLALRSSVISPVY